jgi:hypothetical protein
LPKYRITFLRIRQEPTRLNISESHGNKSVNDNQLSSKFSKDDTIGCRQDIGLGCGSHTMVMPYNRAGCYLTQYQFSKILLQATKRSSIRNEITGFLFARLRSVGMATVFDLQASTFFYMCSGGFNCEVFVFGKHPPLLFCCV